MLNVELQELKPPLIGIELCMRSDQILFAIIQKRMVVVIGCLTIFYVNEGINQNFNARALKL